MAVLSTPTDWAVAAVCGFAESADLLSPGPCHTQRGRKKHGAQCTAQPWSLPTHLPFPGHLGTGQAWTLGQAAGPQPGKRLNILGCPGCLLDYLPTSASKSLDGTSLPGESRESSP